MRVAAPVLQTGRRWLRLPNFQPFACQPAHASPTLAIPSASDADAGTYSVTVSNAFGTATSSNATLGVLDIPVILVQPAGATVVQGGTLVLSAVATNASSYSWSLNGAPVAGASSATLTVTGIQAGEAAEGVEPLQSAFSFISPGCLRERGPALLWTRQSLGQSRQRCLEGGQISTIETIPWALR
jgi:hypothetical protein